jgi:hypothetical protein
MFRVDDFDLDEQFGCFGKLRYSGDETAQSHSNGESDQRGPRFCVKSISSSEFHHFTHFFFVASKAFHLTGCSMQSLFLKIRIIPSIPIIETSPIWCVFIWITHV